jgi:branched-chain amino acid transport system permease protein
MDFSIAAILAQDGISSGAVYALLSLALVLVFSVTRVIFIPQGEFVAFGALTLAAIQADKFPHTATLLVALGCLSLAQEAWGVMRSAERRRTAARSLGIAIAKLVVFPVAVWLLARFLAHSSCRWYCKFC